MKGEYANEISKTSVKQIIYFYPLSEYLHFWRRLCDRYIHEKEIFGGGSEGSHNTGTENIDCALQDHGSDSGDGIVERHRNTDGKHIEHTVSVEVVIFPAGF